eukprot:CAMPEP_0113471506 /NCGR_PEP_ID=MMETSP0014_2-20120614/17011_1 /TAXON_ID=2857 /ORGANISM="Nitzschia sp." /LENGTH=454 /DNA_ID=CAMNT_0000364139 /DNA_START=168 /DNA_END=1532 /DNA_ORIENTATION=+ /assembly_acc=CAM_ASM_000159
MILTRSSNSSNSNDNNNRLISGVGIDDRKTSSSSSSSSTGTVHGPPRATTTTTPPPLRFLLFGLGLVVILLLNHQNAFPNMSHFTITTSNNSNWSQQSQSQSRLATSTTTTTLPTTPKEPRQVPKLADGCYHVFLDVGSNIGNHVRFLYEPQLYPNAKVAKRFFDDAFFFGGGVGGSSSSSSSASSSSSSSSNRNRNTNRNTNRNNNRNICVFSFEPNPDHNERHRQLQQAYQRKGWRYHPINAGVGHQYGNITFYHTGDDLGFTSKQSSCRKRCDPVTVPVIKLSDWIKHEIEGRTIPEYDHSQGDGDGDDDDGKDEASASSPVTIPPPPPPPPRVVMKMDIEMMEYEVFPDLMLSGVLCRNIDSMIGEFHMDNSIAYLWREGMDFANNNNNNNDSTDQGQDKDNVWNLSRDKARQISEEWLRMVGHNPDCQHVKISMKDDESYRNDGQPLPS